MHAALQPVGLFHVRTTLQIQGHGRHQRILGDAQGLEIDLVHRQGKIRLCHLLVYIGIGTGIGHEYVVVAMQFQGCFATPQFGGKPGIVHIPFLVFKMVQVHFRLHPRCPVQRVGAMSAGLGREGEQAYAVLWEELAYVQLGGIQQGPVCHVVKVDGSLCTHLALAAGKLCIGGVFVAVYPGFGRKVHAWDVHSGKSQVPAHEVQVHGACVPLKVRPHSAFCYCIGNISLGLDVHCRGHEQVQGVH